MYVSTVRLILVLCFITAFCIAPVSAQQAETEMQEKLEQQLEEDAELYKKLKASDSFEELQKKLRSYSSSGTVSLDIKLYQKTSGGLKNVTDSVDNVFLVIEQYQCYTYGANPKISHTSKRLGKHQFQTIIWDPDCIMIEVVSKGLGYTGYAEWNPTTFATDSTEITQTKSIDLTDGYVLKVKSTWTRDGVEKPSSEEETGTVIGTLTHFAPHPTKENSRTSQPMTNSEIEIPELDVTVDTDRHGNFVIRDVPAGKLLELTYQSRYANGPDTLTFVAAPNQVIDMGKLLGIKDN